LIIDTWKQFLPEKLITEIWTGQLTLQDPKRLRKLDMSLLQQVISIFHPFSSDATPEQQRDLMKEKVKEYVKGFIGHEIELVI